MTCPVILTDRDKDVLVDIERSGETLRKYVHNVVIAVGRVIEFDPKRVLPLLSLQNMFRIRGVKHEAFEIELAHTMEFWPRLEVHIRVVTDTVGTFKKADLGIEVGPDLAMLAKHLKPAVLEIDPSPKIGLSRGGSRGPRLRSVAG